MKSPIMSPHYRPDIDGIRAIAISSVVGYHSFPRLFSGGYVGVDLFFVVSGFLITSIIIDGLEAGTFRLSTFYARRIRRIFPALILVLATFGVLGWFWLLPDEFSQLGKHIASSSAFINNIVLWQETGYFDQSADHKPMLHLWSLAIEEQFYLVCPFTIMIAWKYQRLFLIALFMMAASFVLNVAIINRYPAAAFYLPLSRSWEFTLGSCLAITRNYGVSISSLTRNVASFVGSACIIISIASFDVTTRFPGWSALLPTVGTALILWSGPEAWLNRAVLSHPTLVFIGVTSYSIYLWHWPMLSFLAIGKANSDLARVTALIVSVVFARMTYLFIETPLRRPSVAPGRLIIALSTVFGVGLSIDYSIVSAHPANYDFYKINAASNDWITIRGAPVRFNDQTYYRDGAPPAEVLLIGDSNMQQYYPRLHDVLLSDRTKSVVYATYGGCPSLPMVASQINPPCFDFSSQVFEFAKSQSFSTVAIASQWDGYFTSPAYSFGDHPLNTANGRTAALAALKSDMETLTKSGKRVYLILNIPIGSELDPKSRISRTLTGPHVVPPMYIKRADLENSYGSIARELTDIGISTGAQVIDPYNYLCDATLCPSTDKFGTPIYKDGTHLRAEFVRKTVRYIDQIFGDTRDPTW